MDLVTFLSDRMPGVTARMAHRLREEAYGSAFGV
jgi:hypothetical protein